VKLPALDATTTAFLQRFFGPGNAIAWEQVVDVPAEHKLAKFLAPWLDDLATDPLSPVVLPRASEHGATVWYALGHSAQDTETLREQLSAFIGPTYSDWDGQPTALDPADSIDGAVREFSHGHVFRFRVLPEHKDTVRDLLLGMHTLWRQKPWRGLRPIRSTGRMLRELELALATRNIAEATARLEELREEGRLDARNLLFLNIRRLAAAERWEDILSLPQLPDLAQLSCPVAVSESALCAIYAVELAVFEQNGDTQGALTHFRTNVVRHWPSFFRVLSTMQEPSALKAFMMLAAVAEPPRPELRDTILFSSSLSTSDRTYCEQLARYVLVPALVHVDPLLEAAARVESGNYDAAFPLLLQAPLTDKKLRLMLYCAVELERLDATRAVHQAMLAAPAPVREAVLGSARYRLLWEHLVGGEDPAPEPPVVASVVEEVPGDWNAWLERLTRHGRWPKALEVAERGAREWSPSVLLTDSDQVTQVQAWIADRQSRDGMAQSVLRDATPHLVGFLLRETSLLSKAKDLLIDLLLLLTDDDEAGASDLVAVRDVVSALLEIGPGPKDYRGYIDLLGQMWTRFEAPRTLEWLLDTVEVLTFHPCPAPEARAQLLSLAAAGFAHWRAHVETEQWRLLDVLYRDLGARALITAVLPAKASSSEPETSGGSLQGRTLAIYSLMERPAQHARDALLEEFPSAKIVLNADKVATDRLKELSQGADVFVMVTWAAKHAATACIESARPKHLPLLRPISKSATAILREVHTYLGTVT